jgi:hypothetical protein
VVATFPIPWEIPAAAGFPTQLLRFCLPEPARDLPPGGDPGLDPRARLLLEAARATPHHGPVWSGGAGDLKEIHAALVAELGPAAVSAFPWPLRPDRRELERALGELALAFGLADLAGAERAFALDEALRAGLRAWDRAHFAPDLPLHDSRTWCDALRGVAARGLLPGRGPALPCPTPPPGVRASWSRTAPAQPARGARPLRLGLAGAGELFTDLPEALEASGFRLVADEWLCACAFLEPAASLVERYLALPLPCGLASRSAALARLERERRVEAWVLITSPFGASNMERMYFPRALSRPVLCLEAERRGPVGAAERLRLDAFRRQA